jgi:Flp pilus assembly protein TadG
VTVPRQLSRHRRDRSDRRTDQRGSVTVWLALSTFIIIFLAGLVVDLGGQVHTQQRAHELAAQAARAGGERVRAAPAVAGTTTAVDAALARSAALDYLTAVGTHGDVAITSEDTMTVTVRETYRTQFLGLIGLHRLDIEASATAHLVRTVGSNPR